jgi:uncharacterized alkaline shock family protein YloU
LNLCYNVSEDNFKELLILDKDNLKDESGIISYSRSILKNIITLAVKEVKGVASLYKSSAKSSYSGVKIEFVDNKVIADIAINIYYGYSVPDVAFMIQENVKRSIETMTEYKVRSVNVSVLSVTFNAENN